MSEEDRKALPVNKILDAFAKVFELEDKMDDDASADVRKKYRDEIVKPALDELFKLIDDEHNNLPPTSVGYMRSALEYAIKFKERFYKAVADPCMPLHNSASERVFARFGILRCNYKQVDTVLGAESICLWFSVLHTSKENGANQLIYLEYLLTTLPDLLREHGDYYWYSIDGLRKSYESGTLPEYGDLTYLDQVLVGGKDFELFAEKYQAEKLVQIKSLANLIEKGKLSA